MAKSGTINDLPVEAVERMLAKDALSIDALIELIAITTDPEKLKLLLAALERAMEQEGAEAERMEDEARQIHEAAQEARARAQSAEEGIRVVLAKIEAEQAQQASTPKIG